jgi:tripartite-type tricarboxylate transporter receptor subunit TctC
MRFAAASAAAASAPRAVRAQAAWPARPIRLIVPYGAGNLADQVARLLAEELAQRWGQRIVADNQPGAGGAIGVAQIARAPADGYTLGLVALAALAVTPHLSRAEPPCNPLRDLTAVAGVTVSRSFLAANAALPARSLAELVAHARARPAADPLFYYSAGSGTIPHLNMEILRRALDFPAQHVPYRTAGAGVTDLIAGRVYLTMDAGAVTMPHIRSGALRAIAVNAPRRDPALPEVPTIGEGAPGLDLPNAWQAVMGPRGLPEALTRRIAADTRAVLEAPGFAERLPAGTETFPADPAEVAARLRQDHERFGRLVAEIGLQAD